MFQMTEEDYEGLRTAQLFRLIFEFEQQGVEASYHNLSQALGDDDLARDLLPGLMIESADSSPAEHNSPERAEREAVESLHSLRCVKLAEKQAVLQFEINQAQRNNDPAQLGELMMLKFELAKRERALAQWTGQWNESGRQKS
jgi:hypothetical protein